jgi:capsular polysaccharide biosynthesis protein
MNKTLAVLLLLLALGAGIAGALLMRDNKPQFEAAAMVRPVWDETDLGAVGGLPTDMETVVLLQNEAAVIRSDVVLQKLLKPAVGETNSAEALAALSERVEVTPVSGATVLRLAMRAASAAEAIQQANELAQAYCDYRVERRQRIARDGISSVTEMFKKQANALREAQAALATAREALGPEQAKEALAESARSGESEKLRELQKQLARVTMVYLTQSNQLARSLNFPTNEVQQLESQVARVKAELVAVSAAIETEARRQQNLRAFWIAQQELEQAEAAYAPARTALAAHERDLAALPQAPATIEEAADSAIELPGRRAATGQACLLAAFGFAVAGGMIWVSAGKRR